MTDAVAWSSSSSAVATVSPAGSVMAVSAGTTTITASSGGKSGSAALTVLPGVVQSVGCGSGPGATLTSVSRDGASTSGNVTVVLTGTGFQATDCVKFGDVAG